MVDRRSGHRYGVVLPQAESGGAGAVKRCDRRRNDRGAGRDRGRGTGRSIDARPGADKAGKDPGARISVVNWTLKTTPSVAVLLLST